MKAIIIGIGTSGLNILEDLQQFHYEFKGVNRPNDVEYLYIETDLSVEPRKTALGTSDIEAISLDLNNPKIMYDNLINQSSIDKAWFPENAMALDKTGAGNLPTIGRFSIWGNGNFKKIKTKIGQAHTRLNVGAQPLRVYIVGTLTGGTGSGLCIDLPYLVKHATSSNIETYGLFLLPGHQEINNIFLQNSYCSVAAIDHYNKINKGKYNGYHVQWPDRALDFNIPPYSRIQYLSMDFSNERAPLRDPKDLIKLAGLNLLINILDLGEFDETGINLNVFHAVREAKLMNAENNNLVNKYTTLGMKLIQYPLRQMEELFALKKVQEIYENWISDEKILFSDFTMKQLSINVKNETDNKFEILFSKSLKLIDANEYKGTKVTTYLNEIACKENFGKELYKELSNKDDRNLFKDIRPFLLQVEDDLIKSLQEEFKNIGKKYSNLQLIQIQIEEFINSINSILAFWKTEYGIDANINNWNNILNKKIEIIDANKGKFSLFIQKDNYIKEQINDIWNLLKFQLTVELLNNIKNGLDNPLSPIISSKDIKLASISEIKNIITKIKESINNKDSKFNISRRIDELNISLSINNDFIYKVFNYGTLQADFINAENKFHNLKELNEAIINMKDGLFAFIEKNQILFQKSDKLYLHGLKIGVKEISNLKLFENEGTDSLNSIISSKIRNDVKLRDVFANNNIDLVANEVPAMLRLHNQTFGSNQDYLPLSFVSSNSNQTRQLISDNSGIKLPTVIEVLGLKDAILVYQDYGLLANDKTINPLENFESIQIGKTKTKDQISEVGINKFCLNRVCYMNSKDFNNYIK